MEFVRGPYGPFFICLNCCFELGFDILIMIDVILIF